MFSLTTNSLSVEEIIDSLWDWLWAAGWEILSSPEEGVGTRLMHIIAIDTRSTQLWQCHLGIVKSFHYDLSLICRVEEDWTFHGMLLGSKLRQVSNITQSFHTFLFWYLCLGNAKVISRRWWLILFNLLCYFGIASTQHLTLPLTFHLILPIQNDGLVTFTHCQR